MIELNDLQKNLLQRIKACGLSKRDLSLKAHLSEGTVGKISSGKSTSFPRIDTVMRLAEVFDCSLDELVYGEKRGKEKTKAIDKELLINAVLRVDEFVKSRNITLDAKKRANAYFIWYTLDLLDENTAAEEKFTAVMRLIK